MIKSKFTFILLIPLIVIFLSKARGVNAQNLTGVFSTIDKAKIEVKIKKDLEAETIVSIPYAPANLPALSWPIPKDAFDVSANNSKGKIKFNLVHQRDRLIVLFPNLADISLAYKTQLTSQKEQKNLWEIFVPLVKEPHAYIQTLDLTIRLPKEATVEDPRLYLIHGGSISSERTEKNIYQARLLLEPYSTLSWEAKTDFAFHLPPTQTIINIVQEHPHLLISSLLILLFGAIIFFWRRYFYSSSTFNASAAQSFLTNSYLCYKRLVPEAIAATIMDWAQKNLIVFIEKDNNIIIGKNRNEPLLPYPEKILWDFLFTDQNRVDLIKIEKQAEKDIVPQALLKLKDFLLAEMQKQGYIRQVKIGSLETRTLLVILSLASLVFLSIAAWISNLPWLILPAIIANFVFVFLGERIPVLTFFTPLGRAGHSKLQEIKAQTLKIKPDWKTIIEQLPWFIFFKEEEKAIKLLEAAPPRPLPFLVSLNTLELPSQKLKKIIRTSLKLGEFINSISRL